MATEIVPAPEGAGLTPTPTSLLAPLVSAVQAAATPAELAAVFDALAEESARLAVETPSECLYRFWGDVNESAAYEARQLRTPSRPRRRWFR